ncbi:MAG TPA: CehA/McbA family metallohydrolase, partial [Verrucomicrobiae bacterium]|nr:CehA/McbA family metallohydrolase [Verrucomicrobiae bacterium]
MKTLFRSALVFSFLLNVTAVEWQPFKAQVTRVLEALDYQGANLPPDDLRAIRDALEKGSTDQDVGKVESLLDNHALVEVNINPESRVKVARGKAAAELAQSGWRAFLVKVVNEAGVTAELRAFSPQGKSVFEGGGFRNASDQRFGRGPRKAEDLWLDVEMFNKQPLTKNLGGLSLEYRIVQIYSRDAGKREAKLMFDVGQGTQDLGFRNEVDILFDAKTSRPITLTVLDENGKPTAGCFEIRDAVGRVYPSQAKRLAPDFGFHPQVYRTNGESIRLPDGKYTIQFSRGPESITETRTLVVNANLGGTTFKVQRWIDPSKKGWWSGDHHIHAAGCAHYTNPTEGVHAPDMIRQCMGEDLKVGANLTWGPCFDYQKQFFTGKNDAVSVYPYLLRYDIEVSGFGSHQSGHLCLLRLKDQMYPGGKSMDHWPTLCYNTLTWAKAQGALVGPAHTGWGLQVRGTDLPNYNVPPFDGIGANEYIVDVTHEVRWHDGKMVPLVDFLSTVDTPYVWELNIWYHTLNAGFRTRVSGETDFPCIYGERVGLGRSYVKLDGKLDYEQWCEAIRAGRNYVGDGKSHLMDFKVNDVKMGENGSELKLSAPGKVKLTAQVAARLNEQPNPDLQKRPYDQKPYWDVERARIGSTRTVAVEAIVNGKPVGHTEIQADGTMREISFDVPIENSSWVALRILPSSHTNPVFVMVGDKPIRSRKSIEWCLKGVDQCWSQ